MGNMHYCRFHNTRMDVNECLDALDEREQLSPSEADAARQMLKAFVEFLTAEGVIDEYDSNALAGIVVEE